MKVSKPLIFFKLSCFIVAIVSTVVFCVCRPEFEIQEKLILSLSIVSTCMTIFISFFPDFFNTCKMINKRGCFSIYNTIDCNNIVKKLEEEIKNGKKVIYLNCQGLKQTDIYNLKLKIHQHFSCSKIKHLSIGNVRYLDKFDIDDFNAQIFENHTRKKNIYIFDYLTTNEYFINMVQNRIQNSKNKKIKSTVIIYLSNHSVKVDGQKNTSGNRTLNSNLVNDFITKIKDRNKDIKNVITLYNIITSDKTICDSLYCDQIDKIEDIDYKIDKISIKYYLEVGKYDEAIKKIKKAIENKEYNDRMLFADYDFIYILSDTFHLTNRYSLALEIIEKYYSYPMDVNLQKKFLKLKMHILKHQGKFNESFLFGNELKKCFPDDDLNCKLLSINMLQVINDKLDKPVDIILNDYSNLFESIKLFTPNSLDVMPRYNMYKAIIIAYKNVNQSMHLIDDCIEFFENTNSRYKYNAYYVKAELLRYMNRFLEAYQYYLKSSGICDGHYDKNLLDQNYFSTKCLEKLGLVNGNLSERIREYKKTNDLSEFYKESIDHLHLINLEGYATKDTLLFNEKLLSLVDDNEFNADKIKAILLKCLFIIL